MSGDEPAEWKPKFLATKRRGGTYCPAYRYIRSETDARVRAKIMAKISHLAKVGRADARRPLVDTLDGPVKELRVDQQIRILFSWEDPDILLILGGTRKKNGGVDGGVIADARRDRDAWADDPSFAALSYEKVSQAL